MVTRRGHRGERDRDERLRGQRANVSGRRPRIRPASADPGPAPAKPPTPRTRAAAAAKPTAPRRLTAQQLNRLPDAQRWAYVGKHGRPTPPAGMVWAEDHSLVKKSFYSKTDTRKVK